MKKRKILQGVFIFIISISFGQDNTRMDLISEIVRKATIHSDANKFGLDEYESRKATSLYSEYYKQKAYEDALLSWRYIFFNAPKSSENIYIRGAKMYKYLISNAEEQERESFLDTLFAIHQTRIACYGNSIKSQKSNATDWYKYRSIGNETYVLALFSKTIDKYLKNEKIPSALFLSQWIDIAVKTEQKTQKINADSVLVIYGAVSEIFDEYYKDKQETKNIIDELLDKGNYIQCDHLIMLMEKKHQQNPGDTIIIDKIYRSLKNASCTDSPFFLKVAIEKNNIYPTVPLCLFISQKYKKAKNYNASIEYLEQALVLTEDKKLTEKILLKIASMYYNQAKFIKVRETANKALVINPNSGKAYLIIGRTYASSGKLCGTGTDFKSHTIVWAAVDTWKKAKKVDSSVYSEAQTLINKYSQYMPTKKELFMNGVTIGSSYTIVCFGFTTIVRSSD